MCDLSCCHVANLLHAHMMQDLLPYYAYTGISIRTSKNLIDVILSRLM